jgi:enoyl-CoA hydratase/carnithine racemase
VSGAIEPQLLVQREGAVASLVFSNPAKLNALTREMWRRIPETLQALDADPAVRVICLKGAGEKAFVSGADISEFATLRESPEAQAEYDRAVDRAYGAPLACAKPVIAAVRGLCYGGGLGLALACDLRLIAADATFRMSAARLGLGYTYAGIRRFVQVLGEANTADLFFSARAFGAAEAVQMGLAPRAIAPADFAREVALYCATVAENAPLTLIAAKRAIGELRKDPGERDLAAVDTLVQRCFASRDFREGQRAFAEKRKPAFTGS